ncbi:MAG: aminodeoxychorismate lyase, partial [Mycobacterium sp.]|nr:aminodeoxychorismate lyase [Mycobacterium sp.]
MSEGTRRGRARPKAVAPQRRRSRAERSRARRNRRRRRITGGLATVLLIVVVVAAVFLGSKLWHNVSRGENDYTGNGKRDVLIQVQSGDSTTAIGETLHNLNVVRTVRAFVEAAYGNSAIASIQPGFYRMRTEIPARSAVKRL